MSKPCPVCGNAVDDTADACPFCGFKLLGSTQSFKPLDVEGASARHERIAESHPRFDVVRGPQTGMSIEIAKGKLTVGRNPQCDIFLNDMTVSRLHATVENDGATCTIRDESSFNGVWVNNDSVSCAQLSSGDVVQIGAFCLVFEQGD